MGAAACPTPDLQGRMELVVGRFVNPVSIEMWSLSPKKQFKRNYSSPHTHHLLYIKYTSKRLHMRVRARERERESVCVCVCMCARARARAYISVFESISACICISTTQERVLYQPVGSRSIRQAATTKHPNTPTIAVLTDSAPLLAFPVPLLSLSLSFPPRRPPPPNVHDALLSR